MTLGQTAVATLKAWGAFTDDRRNLSAANEQVSITAHVTDADTRSCSLSTIELESRPARTLDANALRNWGDRLATRVRYLLEAIEVIELDTAHGRLLLRSTPPERTPDGSVYYYELLLHATGQLRLERFRFDHSARTRSPNPMHCTHELLQKLVDDLSAAQP